MISQPLLLAIETATKICSVALFKGNTLLAVKESGNSYSHAENLAQYAKELLREQDVSFSSLDAVVVSKGPGSYTGLRIGVSFSKGVCYALNIPLISINTLEAMAWGAIQRSSAQEAYYCPMIDARRLEVYTAVFNNEMRREEQDSAKVLDNNFFEKYYKKATFYVFGDGSEKALGIVKHSNFVYLESCFPSAANLGVLAFEKFKEDEFEDLAYFEPYYLKEYIALKSKRMV